MKELTFREVIANIKDGEIWEHRNFVIEIEDNGNHEIKIRHKEGFSDCSAIYFEPSDKFQLQRKTYSFAEAFKAYEEGKEIECCYGGQILKKENEKDYCFDYEKGKYVPLSFDETFFDITNIRSEWYIND